MWRQRRPDPFLHRPNRTLPNLQLKRTVYQGAVVHLRICDQGGRGFEWFSERLKHASKWHSASFYTGGSADRPSSPR